MDFVWILAGLVLLLLGGDWLVKASIDIALRAKISLLVVGMTVVSFATSAPELLVSLKAALGGHVDISFGNVIGSNLANIALILGLTALVFPLDVSEKSMRSDYWVMMGVTVLLLIFLLGGVLVFWEAAVLFGILVIYNVVQIRASRKLGKKAGAEAAAPSRKWWWMVLYLLGGAVGLRFGAEFLIRGSVNLASTWGVSERVIGLTVVSIGTSLPELAASLVASFKGQQDISIGNLIGSNIFNILAVLGITGLMVDLPVKSEQLLYYDFPWLFGISVLLFLFMRFLPRGQINRWQGGLLLLAYLLYLTGVIFL